QRTLDLRKLLAKHSRDEIYVRIALGADGAVTSEETVFLAPPRFLEVPRGKVRCRVKAIGEHGRDVELTFTSPVVQHRFAFDVAGVDHRASDNYFELYPGEAKTVTVTLARKVAVERFRQALSWRSLVDTY